MPTRRQRITLAAGDLVRIAFPIPENKSFSGVYSVVETIAKSAILQIGDERRAVGIDQLELAPPAVAVEVVASSAVARLAQVESDIQNGLTQIEAGRSRLWAAVSAVKSEELWREAGYDSFPAYCKARWGWKKSNAYDNAVAGEVYQGLVGSGTAENEVPQSLGAMRELAKLPEGDRAGVLRQAAATGSPVTAKAVRQAAATGKLSPPAESPAPLPGVIRIQGDPSPWLVTYRSPDGTSLRLRRGAA